MKNKAERRSSERLYIETPIVYTPQYVSKKHASRMYNNSTGGMCFVSDYALHPGEKIFVQLESYSMDVHTTREMEDQWAEVKWCQEVSDIYASYYGRYEIGLQYVKNRMQLGDRWEH